MRRSDNGRPPSSFLSRITALVCLTALAVAVSPAQRTENVLLLVIDGARYSETFGDTAHRYIPRMWSELVPQGVYYTNIYNDSVTKTNAAHASILTGTWQAIANDGSERPHLPTLFEYYRKQTGSTLEQNAVVLGKEKLDILAYSDHTGYGPAYGAAVTFSASQYDDAVTFQNILAAIATSHPRLLLANFAGTDKAGHDGPFANYCSKLQRVDSLIVALWDLIQADAFYGGKTTLIIVNDHGRHLDGVADGFRGHGDHCGGCRHIGMVLVGPDTPAGCTDTVYRQQIDIAPTVARMMGFSVPYATGSLIPTAFTTGVAGEAGDVPAGFALAHNFPNPFNPLTHIGITLPAGAWVRLGIYDLLGRTVAILLEGDMPPGIHHAQWDAVGYPSGVYICRLEKRDHAGTSWSPMAVGKMILLR